MTVWFLISARDDSLVFDVNFRFSTDVECSVDREVHATADREVGVTRSCGDEPIRPSKSGPLNQQEDALAHVVSQKFVEEQTRVPFDFAQGRLSTAIGAKNAPISAQDDSLVFDLRSG
jgi:hypothetical protein